MSLMPLIAAAVVLLVGFALIATQAWFASRDGWLTLKQMLKHHSAGLPFEAHIGMWEDIPLTILLADIVYIYGSNWTHGDILRAFLIAGIISAFLHYTYTLSSFPEAHVRDHRLTVTGWFHAVYMTGALTILALFYFPSHVHYEGASDRFLMTFTSVFLCFHVFCATHIPLSLLNFPWFPEKPSKNPLTLITLMGVFALLTWRTFIIIQ